MISRWMRAAGLAALAPAAALAFDTVDTLPWPSAGAFPAYSAEAVRPWTAWVYAGAMWDNNVLRLEGGGPNDVITRFGAGVRTDGLVYGRQRLLIEAMGEFRDYYDHSKLDHFAHALRGEWLWELGNELSGTAGARRRRRLADVGELQREVRDMVTDDRLYASAAYRFMPDWRLVGGAEYAHITHSGRAVASATGNTLRGGVEHVSPLGNTLGVEYRRSQGDAPVVEELGLGAFPNNEYEERELAATASYALGPSLGLSGRLGRTTRTYTELEGRDFKGTTGRGRVEWLPGAKTRLELEVYREPSALIDAVAVHVVRRGIAFGPSWAATAKLVLSGRFVNERRLYQGDVDLLGEPQRDETIRVLRGGVGWEPDRRLQVSGAIDVGRRDSNTSGRDYQYIALMFNLRFSY
jgi:hypothetical protein